jgi:hypothetical protein
VGAMMVIGISELIMTQFKRCLLALAAVLLLALPGLKGRAYAQQASPPPSNYGGPFIANPGAIPPEELKRHFQKHEEYCRTHPGACIAPNNVPPPLNRYTGPDGRLNPGHLGHTTVCHPEPNNPSKPICVHY